MDFRPIDRRPLLINLLIQGNALQREIRMRSGQMLKAVLLGISLAVVSGCTDLKPLQDQIDDLTSRLDQLQRDTKSAARAANAATASATDMQKTIGQLESATQSNTEAITALSDKIDQMFKRPMTKQPAAGAGPTPPTPPAQADEP
jgi:chromosome segregation ATPase